MANESAPFDREAFERWRNAHPGNAKAFNEALRTWNLPLPVDATRYAEDVGHEVVSPVQSIRSFVGPLVALAAVLLVALVAVGLRSLEPFGHTEGSRAVALASPLVTGGQSRAFRLSDGSVATLGPASALRISFSDDVRRLVLVRGHARFDVAHDKDRRFEVAAGGNVIVARGTVFEVRMTDQAVRVALLRGVIDVESAVAGKTIGRVRRLGPGETITVPISAETKSSRSPSSVAAGSKTILTFEQTSLSDAVAAFNARTATKIVIDPKLGTETITGGFDANDPVGFANMLAAMFNLRLIRDADGALHLSAAR